MWSLTKRFRGKTDNNACKIKINNGTANDTDRANCVAKIFEKSHKITSTFTHANDTEVKKSINAFNAFSHMQCQTPEVKTVEIIQIIRSLKPFNAPGPDLIQNILLKNLPQSTIEWLTKSFNKCLRLSYWPANFKTAKVIPILKAGKSPSDPHSYRPISLLNATGKIFERVIYARLIKCIDEKKLLPNNQFGFRKGDIQRFTKRPKSSNSSAQKKQIFNRYGSA